jgi:hypothetical protein
MNWAEKQYQGDVLCLAWHEFYGPLSLMGPMGPGENPTRDAAPHAVNLKRKLFIVFGRLFPHESRDD